MSGALLAILFLLPGPPAEAPPGVSVRRIYAPADRMDQWPLGAQRYLPVEAGEFERLLRAAQAAGSGPDPSLAVRIVQAEYRARLDGEQLVDGQAELRIGTSNPGGGLLGLGACSLAISQPTWIAPNAGPAVMGLSSRGGAALVVGRSGQLGFGWSLRGRTDESGSVHFPFQLPPSPVSRLVVDLPPGASFVADRGIASRTGKAPAGLARWQVELGGQTRAQLSITPAGARRPASLVQVRQTTVYDFSLQGVDVAVQLAMNIPSQALSKLTLAIDPGVDVLAARCGDRRVQWSLEPAESGEERRLELSFPDPISGSQVVRLSGLAPLQTTRPWRLPRMQPLGVYWQQGATTLLVPQPLVVNRLLCDGCRQSGVGPLPAPRSGESIQLECFAPQGTAEILLGRRKPRLTLASGLALDVGSGVIKGQLTADLRVADGELFTLSGDVGRNWIINAVECTPADVLEDWSHDRAEGKQRLTLSFLKALSPARPVRLKIAARRLNAGQGRPLTVEDLVPLRFPGATLSRGLLGLSVNGPFDLKLTGEDQVLRLDPAKLEARDRELLAETPRDLVFLDDANAVGLTIGLERRRPGYAASIAVEAMVRGSLLEETYNVRCVPQAAPVERLVVHLSSYRESPLRWSIAGHSDDWLDARRLSLEEQAAAGLAPGEEAWEVVLRRPSADPFEFRGTRRSLLSGQQGVSLASLPEATRQEATLNIRSPAAEELRIRNQHLAPLPLVGRGRTAPLVRASFRYDPRRQVTGLLHPAVTVGLAEQPGTSENWIWDCRLQSRYAADGAGLHVAVYRLQNRSLARFRLTLAPGIDRGDVRGAWVGETAVPWCTAPDDPRRLEIDLPPGERSVTLSVQFTSRAAPLALRGNLVAPLPGAEVPVLGGQWTVWLPPGYEPIRADCEGDIPALVRLFGPLARRNAQGAWHPFGSRDLPFAAGSRESRQACQERGDRLLRALDAALRSAAGETPWGRLLQDAARAARVPVLVDRPAVAAAGVEPLSPVRAAAGVDAAARAAAILAQENLALLVHEESLLLTSQAAAAAAGSSVEAIVPWPLARVLPGMLADQIRDCAAGKATDPLVPLEVWACAPQQAPPWSVPTLAGSQPVDLTGWSACTVDIAASGAPALSYVERRPLQLFGWVAFFGLVGAAAVIAAHRSVLILASGAAAAAALLVPALCLPFATASFLAIVTCLLLAWIRRRDAPGRGEPASRASEIPSTLTGTQLWLVPFALLLWGGAAGAAQAPSASGAKAGQVAVKHYNVFIPTDDQQKPTGGKYYVPEELFSELHRQAAGEPARSWLLTGAEYEATLGWQAAPEGLAVERLKAVFHVWSFEAKARVRVPLSRTAAELVEGEATLDGRPIRVEWDLDSAGLLVDAPEPGPSRLEVVLRPASKTTGAEVGLDLVVPALPDARLEVVVPEGAPPLKFPSATGVVRRSEENGRWLVELGPTPRLSLNWPAGARRASGGNRVDVEELIWLKVQPNGVLIDTRFKYKVVEGQLRSLQLACDPRLRLLPLKAAGMTVTEAPAAGGPTQIVQIDLARPVSDQVVFEGTFLLSGTAPAGNLRLPLLESVGLQRTRRWLGVSVDSALGFEEQSPEPLESVSLPDFAEQWGGDALPQLACKLPPRSLWAIAIRPRRPQTVADQTLRLSFGPAGADVQFEAELSTSGGYCLHHRVAAPAALAVERVSVMEEGVERASRWASGDDGSLWVFLSAPVSGKQVLSLRGRLPTPAQGAFGLPHFQVLQAQIASSAVEIFRRAATSARVTAMRGLVELQSPVAEQARSELGRLVGAFMVDGNKHPSATVQLAPNVPVVETRQTIGLVPSGAGWRAEAEFELEVKQGTLERLEIEMDAPAAAPFELVPAEPMRVVTEPGQTPLLIVEPARPIRGSYRLRVSSGLAITAGSPVRVPDIRLRGFPAGQRVVVLPGMSQGRALAWETLGLRAVALPAVAQQPEVCQRLEKPTVYRVQSEPLRASLRLGDEAAAGGEVRLALISVCLAGDGTLNGLAAFDVIPGALRECPLDLPEPCELIQVYVAGQPVDPEPRGKHQWQVPLLLGRLPQAVEVLFRGPVGTGNPGEPSLYAPRLGRLPTGQTVWRILGPDARQVRASENMHLLPPVRGELLRLRAAMALAGVDSESFAAEPEELYCWHALYATRLARRRAGVEAALAEAVWAGRDTSEPPDAIRAELKAAEAQQARLEAWLAANPSLAPSSQDASFGLGLQFLWSETAERGRSPVYVEAAGWLGQVRVESAEGRTPGHWGGAIVAGLIALGLVGVLRFAWFNAWLSHSGYLLAGLTGLGWWLFLWPGFVGGLLILGSLWFAVSERWQRARRRAAPATISVGRASHLSRP